MTKSELIEAIARKQKHLPAKDVELAVNLLFNSMADALKQGQKIEIRGFGSFKAIQREARVGRNPKTGEKVDVAPKRTVHFKAGKELKERVDK